MSKIEIINRAEFFRRYPPNQRGIHISTEHGVVADIPVGEEIICDFCNKEIAEEIYLYNHSHALCPKCGKKVAAEICNGI